MQSSLVCVSRTLFALVWFICTTASMHSFPLSVHVYGCHFVLIAALLCKTGGIPPRGLQECLSPDTAAPAIKMQNKPRHFGGILSSLLHCNAEASDSLPLVFSIIVPQTCNSSDVPLLLKICTGLFYAGAALAWLPATSVPGEPGNQHNQCSCHLPSCPCDW